MSDNDDLASLAETPAEAAAEAAAEAQQAQLDAREAVGADLDDDGEDVFAGEEGIS